MRTKFLYCIIFVLIIGLLSGCVRGNSFNKSKLEEITGMELVESKTDLFGIHICHEYKYKEYDENNDFCKLRYYCFWDERSAKAAIEEYADEYLDENSIKKTENTIEGWEKGVCDASIYSWYYIDENLVVLCEACYGNFVMAGEEDELNAQNEKENEWFNETIKWIPEIF